MTSALSSRPTQASIASPVQLAMLALETARRGACDRNDWHGKMSGRSDVA